ncbi:hypothetical protein SAMN05892883_0854 [Jatrophihabitans sp. GAS493]|nr:hypothetical protein [Jatrophihabitans sp. GAS493]SOD71315.1 hypothetical protein SAMN05892883_0854 [Jatrophihabitans sp. GAS493]
MLNILVEGMLLGAVVLGAVVLGAVVLAVVACFRRARRARGSWRMG